MAGRKKAQSKVKQDYYRERGRIQRQINRMKARGYTVNIKLPEIPKRIAPGSVRRLKKITTAKLYEESEYRDPKTGETISGTRRRVAERKASAEKAKATRKRKKERRITEAPQQPDAFSEQVRQSIIDTRKAEDAARARKKADAVNRKRLQEDEKFREQFTNAAMVKQAMMSFLDDQEQDYPQTIASIRDLIENMINIQGEDQFWKRMAEIPDLFENLDMVFYRPVDHIRPTAFNKLREQITGGAMSAQEMQEASDRYEEDIAYSVDVDEIWD